MRKKYYFIGVLFWFMVTLSFNCFASDMQQDWESGALLIVVDKSKETYGGKLQEEVFSRLKKALNNRISETSDGYYKHENGDLIDITKAERQDLHALAQTTGVKKVLVVEILPLKSDFQEVIFYKAVKSEATLNIRLYDLEKEQYILHEETSGVGTNKTYIPYTSVGKKTTVLKAVYSAVDAAARRISDVD